GIVMWLVNLFMTWRSRPATYEEPVHEAPALTDYAGQSPAFELPAHPTMLDAAYRIRYFSAAAWHRVWERKPLRFTLWVAAAVVVASLFEMIPTFLVRSNVPTI